MESEGRVAIDELVQAVGAEGERRRDLVAVDGLVPARDVSVLDQIDDAVREHFRPDAEVLLVLERLQAGVGDLPDAHLERRAVVHQRGDVAPDLQGGFVEGLARQVGEGVLAQHPGVDLVHGHESGPVDHRHFGVDLRDHERRGLDGREDHVHRDAQVDEAEGIGRRGLDEGHVDRHAPGSDHRRDLRQEDRGVVGAALVDRLAYVRADEECVVAEAVGVLGLDVGGGPESS